jgi:hypothetical protein
LQFPAKCVSIPLHEVLIIGEGKKIAIIAFLYAERDMNIEKFRHRVLYVRGSA